MFMKKMHFSLFFTFKLLYGLNIQSLDGTLLRLKKGILGSPKSCILSFLDIVIKKVLCHDGVLHLSLGGSPGVPLAR